LNELSIAVEAQQDNQAAEVEIQKDSLNEKNNECKSHAAENELSLLQVQQLQEELEQMVLKQASLSKADATGTEITALKKERDDLAAENELSLLQIHQLQEELEYYYTKLQQQGSLEHSIASSEDISPGMMNCIRLLSHINH
jgi:peptidoglycan hydrolase CwlO-like protein